MELTTRRRARECAVQAIYAWQVSHNNIDDIEVQFLEEQDTLGMDIAYFQKLYTGVTIHAKELDRLMAPHLSRQLKELDYVELAVLRIALFELSKNQDVPYRVAINEAIELAKTFGAEKSHKFINGVLDKVVTQIHFSKKYKISSEK